MQFVLFSCQKDKAMEGQGIQLPLECNASEEFSIHYLHLFAIDRDNRIARESVSGRIVSTVRQSVFRQSRIWQNASRHSPAG